MVDDVNEGDMSSKFTEDAFTQKCEQDQLYQIEVTKLSLIASMQACYYSKQSGLNDTLSFSTNKDSSKIIGMHIDTRDIKYLASLERNPRKKRLMQERQYGKFVGKAVLSTMIQGSQPEFGKAAYDSLGGEKKVQAPPVIGADGK